MFARILTRPEPGYYCSSADCYFVHQPAGVTETVYGADLDAHHPGIAERIVDDAGLRRFVNVYLNDEDVRFLDGIDTALSDGDVVTVLPRL